VPGGGFSDEEATRVDPNAATLSLIARGGPITPGSVFGSDGAPITIGRAAGCAIVLPIAESSRRHSRIEYRSGRFWLSDLDTLNGTRLNGRLVREPAVLEDDDVIEICGQQLQVRHGKVKGRRVVRDAFPTQPGVDAETEPLAVGQPLKVERERIPTWAAVRPPAPPNRVRPILFAMVAVLSALVATGVALLVVGRVDATATAPTPKTPRANANANVNANANANVNANVNANANANANVNANAPRAAATLTATDVLIIPSHASGRVKEIVPRGTPVSAHETVANLEDPSLERKKREYARAQDKYADNDDYAEFLEEQRLELEKMHLVHIQTPSAGIVISTAVTEGQRIRRGDEVGRVAGLVELRIDAAAVAGAGPACKVALKPGVIVDGTLSTATDGPWRTITLGRLPPDIEPGAFPTARATCTPRTSF